MRKKNFEDTVAQQAQKVGKKRKVESRNQGTTLKKEPKRFFDHFLKSSTLYRFDKVENVIRENFLSFMSFTRYQQPICVPSQSLRWPPTSFQSKLFPEILL